MAEHLHYPYRDSTVLLLETGVEAWCSVKISCENPGGREVLCGAIRREDRRVIGTGEQGGTDATRSVYPESKGFFSWLEALVTSRN